MKRKILAVIMCAVMLTGILSLAATALSTGDFMFEVYPDMNWAAITAYIGSEEEIELPSEFGGYPVIAIGYHAFENCTTLRSVIISESITSLNDYAFAGCSNLESVTIPMDTQLVGADIFTGCPATLTIYSYYNSDAERHAEEFSINFVYLDNFADFYSYELLDGGGIRITGTVTEPRADTIVPSYIDGYPVREIGENAFRDCNEMVTLTVNSGIRIIDDLAITNCTKLKSISLPYSVRSLSGRSFLSNPQLERIDINWRNSRYCSVDGVVYSKDQSTLVCVPYKAVINSKYTVPDTVTTVNDYAILSSSTYITVHIPESVTSIGDNAFAYCGGENVVIRCVAGSYAEQWAIGHGISYGCSEGLFDYEFNSDNTIKITYINALEPTDVVIPSEINGHPVTALGAYMVRNNPNVVSLVIPEGVTTIEYACFADSSITDITLPSTIKSYTSLGGLQCEEIIIPEGAISIGTRTISINGFLKRLVLPSTLKTISKEAFRNCYNLESVVLPEGVETIGDSAFAACYRLKELTIPESVTKLGESVVRQDDELETLIIKAKVKKIGKYFAWGCDALKYLEISDTVETIEKYSFYKCTSLESVVIPNSVTAIDSGAFKDCSSLTDLILPKSLSTVGSYAFYNCPLSGDIVFSDTIKEIGDSAFAGCETAGGGLNSITIPTVGYKTFIGSGVFKDSGLKIIYGFPNSYYPQLRAKENGITFIPVNTGDADGDGSVGLSDFVIAKSYVGGAELDSQTAMVLDVNADGAVDAFDMFELDKTINSK